jgi:hypothetical protein
LDTTSVSWIRRCAIGSGALALSLVIATETARGQGAASEWPATHAAKAHPPEVAHLPGAGPAQANEQQASTGQAATSSAHATDPQPTNIFISVRINSPGDNGAVAQTSTTAVAGAAANDASTAQDAWQDWSSGGHAREGRPQASTQNSGTDQAAAATATATRPRPINAVISVRVNSPGDDAPVTQSNTVVVGASSTNAAATTQKADQAQVGAAGPAAAKPQPSTSQRPAPPKTSGATAGQPATAAQPSAAPPDTPAPAPCVSIAPGPAGKAAARVVITIGASCSDAAGTRPAATPAVSRVPAGQTPTHEATESRPVSVHGPATAPPAPVVHEDAAPTPRKSASSPPVAAANAGPTPAPAAPRARIAEPRSLDAPASTDFSGLSAAARSPSQRVAAGGTRYGVMLALLLATLGAAALWSYAAAHPRHSWRER